MFKILLLFAISLFPATCLAQILTTEYQFSPPKYYKSGGSEKGICIDIIDALNTHLAADSIQITLANPDGPFRRFNQLQSDLKKGEIDVFVGLAKTAVRESTYQF